MFGVGAAGDLASFEAERLNGDVAERGYGARRGENKCQESHVKCTIHEISPAWFVVGVLVRLGDADDGAEEDVVEGEGKVEAERFCSLSTASMYPLARTVTMTRGLVGSSFKTSRRRATAISTVRVCMPRGSRPQTRERSSSRAIARPRFAMR